MSLYSRLLGGPADGPSPADPATPAVPASAAADGAAPPAPEPDAAAISRQEEAALEAAIAAGDDAAIAGWVLRGSATQVRQRAAREIHDLARIRELLRELRGGNDKHVYRILDDERERLLGAERREQQLHEEIEAAATVLERHAPRTHDPLYLPTLEQLEKRWQAVATAAAPEIRARAEQAIARAHGYLAATAQERAAAAEQARAAAEQAQAEVAARAQREQEAAAQAEAARQAAEQERQERELRAQAAARAVEALLGRLRALQGAVQQGQSARAARLREELAAQLAAAPPLPPWYARQLALCDERLQELKDWNTYTAAPKRAELLQRMHGLVGADLSPEELARHIKRLQSEWKTLHRGAAEASAEEDEQFRQVAAKAYEPCRAHFEQQAGERRVHVQEREAILGRLAAYGAKVAVDAPDPRELMQVLAEARAAWQAHANVGREPARELRGRFEATVAPIQQLLRELLARHAAQRRELIARAEALRAAPDARDAAERAKGLQQEWRAAGFLPHKEAEALWGEFRAHCDAIFEQRGAQAAALGAAAEAALAEAGELVAQGEALAAGAAADPADAAAGIEQLRARLQSLDLQRQPVRELQRRFERATRTVREAVAGHAAHEARRAWSDVLSIASAIRGLAGPAAPPEARAELEARIAAQSRWPARTRQAVDAALAAAIAGHGPGDVASNAGELLRLCVHAELVSGQDTPAADQGLRREVQLKRLVSTMGQGARPAGEELGELALRWIAVGPVVGSEAAPLEERFLRCLGAAPT